MTPEEFLALKIASLAPDPQEQKANLERVKEVPYELLKEILVRLRGS